MITSNVMFIERRQQTASHWWIWKAVVTGPRVILGVLQALANVFLLFLFLFCINDLPDHLTSNLRPFPGDQLVLEAWTIAVWQSQAVKGPASTHYTERDVIIRGVTSSPMKCHCFHHVQECKLGMQMYTLYGNAVSHASDTIYKIMYNCMYLGITVKASAYVIACPATFTTRPTPIEKCFSVCRIVNMIHSAVFARVASYAINKSRYLGTLRH